MARMHHETLLIHTAPGTTPEDGIRCLVLVSSGDRLDGVKAFNEKRAQRWSGR